MRWYAKLSNGDVEAMTLDDLDVAYENGTVDANTLILAPDATEWVELGELVSLSESKAGGADTCTTNAPIDVPPPPRGRSRWVAPIVFATVAAAGFVAAGFEARQAGAFSRRQVPAEPAEEASPPRAPLATAGAPSLVAGVDPNAHPDPKEMDRRLKRNPPRTIGANVSSSAQPPVFTSGGDPHDPLNADLP
jgi:hypothetical protein